MERVPKTNEKQERHSEKKTECLSFCADNEPKSVLARDLGECRDNLRNSQSVFLIVLCRNINCIRNGKWNKNETKINCQAAKSRKKLSKTRQNHYQNSCKCRKNSENWKSGTDGTKTVWNIRKHGTEETGIAEEKSEKGAKTEKTVVHTAQKKKKKIRANVENNEKKQKIR